MSVEEFIVGAVGCADGPDGGSRAKVFGGEGDILWDGEFAVGDGDAVDAGLAPLAELVDRHAVRSRDDAGDVGGAVLGDLPPVLITLGGVLEIGIGL